MAVATSKTSPQNNTVGKLINFEVFHIDQIPDAMRKMGWEVSAQMMEHWFSISPALKMNEKQKTDYITRDPRELPSSIVNNSIIKMKWALDFLQPQEAIQYLSLNWNNPAGVNLLQDRLKNSGWNGKNSIRIGDSNDSLELEATAQVNVRRVGGFLDTLNDWYGAIGNAQVKIAVRGYTQTKEGKNFFIVEKLGFYIKDTYDFLSATRWSAWRGSEPLGIWSKNRVLNKAESILYMESYTLMQYGYLARKFSGYVPVFNSDFREWQDKHNAGGDYIVYSDVYWTLPINGQTSIEIKYE